MKLPQCLIASLVAVAPLAQAEVVKFSTDLVPEVANATGSGTVLLTWDSTLHTLAIDADWTGLSSTTTIAHIHCCTAVAGSGTASVAVTPGTLPNFPVGITEGSYDITLDLADVATYTGGFLTNFGGGTVAGAETALINSFNDGTSYFNIHTDLFPGGEIRGFFAPVAVAVPEPGTYTLMLLGLAGMAVARRRSSA